MAFIIAPNYIYPHEYILEVLYCNKAHIYLDNTSSKFSAPKITNNLNEHC